MRAFASRRAAAKRKTNFRFPLDQKKMVCRMRGSLERRGSKKEENDAVKILLDRIEKVCKMRASLGFAASGLGSLM
jgi:hypothetical protein